MMSQPLWVKVLIALVFGGVAGIFLQPSFGLFSAETSAQIIGWVAFPGYLFLGFLKMIAVPLVLAAVVCGVAGAGNLISAQKLGLRVVVYFMATTTIAVSIGAVLALLINPGQWANSDEISELPAAMAQAEVAGPVAHLAERLAGILPTNPFTSLADGSMLQIVIFASVLGAALLAMPAKNKTPVLTVFEGFQAAFMKVVDWVLRLAPLAVFGLICKAVAGLGGGAVLAMAAYAGTVVLALALMGGVHLLILTVFARKNLFSFLKQARNVHLFAFSTSSSAATMPITLKTAEEEMKIPPEVARFTIPLGTTINMDGTALYQAVATVFIAQVFAVDIGLPEILTVLIMAIAASIGTPGLPGVGIVILASILISIGIPAEGIALIIGVDRLLDMFRTTLNVNGDLVATHVMARLSKK